MEKLFRNKKLVLVLDLDNTLIHTKDYGVDKSVNSINFKQQDTDLNIYAA